MPKKIATKDTSIQPIQYVGKDRAVDIDGVAYPVRFGHLALSIYNKNGHDQAALGSVVGLYPYYYAAICAGCQRNQVQPPSEDAFMTALDDDPKLFDTIKAINDEQNTGTTAK